MKKNRATKDSVGKDKIEFDEKNKSYNPLAICLWIIALLILIALPLYLFIIKL